MIFLQLLLQQPAQPAGGLPVSIETIFIFGSSLVTLGTWYLSRRKIKEVHVLVNSQMSAAMAHIEDLKAENKKQQDELLRIRTESAEQAEREAVRAQEIAKELADRTDHAADILRAANATAADLLMRSNDLAHERWQQENAKLQQELAEMRQPIDKISAPPTPGTVIGTMQADVISPDGPVIGNVVGNVVAPEPEA